MRNQRVVAIVSGLGITLGPAACGSTAGPAQPASISAPTTVRAATTTSLATAAGTGGATSSTTAPGPPLRLGQEATTRDGNKVRVLTYQQPVPAALLEADAGKEFAAVEAEICAGGRAAPRVTPDSFKVELPDGTRRGRSYFGPKEPVLADAKLASGECARGWVSFEVPEGERPAYVVFQGSTMVRWSAGGRR